MTSFRSFAVLWIVLAALLLVYSYLDLQYNPWLMQETTFSMKPDLSRIGDLAHWGGRLLKHGELPLLLANVLLLSGAVALVLSGLRKSKD